MNRNIITIANYTFFEAVRSRLFYMIVISIIIIFGLTLFVGELAITESREIQVLFMAFILRIFAISTIALFVISSMVREFNDKGFEMIMSHPVPRANYYFGKFLGFILFSIIIGILSSLLLLLQAQFLPLLIWLVSLLCEFLIIISLSILCLFTFSNVTIAFMVVMSFYLLSRSMSAIQLISESPILEFKTYSQEFMNTMVDALSFVLPELDIFTRSEWLTGAVSSVQLIPVILQTLIYVTILSAAALFDLYRKDL